MGHVVSASRRTDLAAFFPDELARCLREGTAHVLGPSGRAYDVDLCPESVHTLVLWSKDFTNVLEDRARLRRLIGGYAQSYYHLTITGLGGTPLEPGAPAPGRAMAQLPGLVSLAGRPERVSVRFDPIVFWREGGTLRTNLPFFERLAPRVSEAGIRDVRVSFAQWYGKARMRAARRGVEFVDPPEEEKRSGALELAATASKWGLTLHACAQDALAALPGFRRSSCIDGARLSDLHPRQERAPVRKDRSQRLECGCTESRDIGSYAQACPHSCVYCYASPAP